MTDLPGGSSMTDEVFLLSPAALGQNWDVAHGQRTGKSLADFKTIFQQELLADLEKTQCAPGDAAWKRTLAALYEMKDSFEALGRRIFDIEKALAEGIKINTDDTVAPKKTPPAGNESNQSSWNPAFGDGPGEAGPRPGSIAYVIRLALAAAIAPKK